MLLSIRNTEGISKMSFVDFNDPSLLQDIDRFVRTHEEDIVRDIARLVSIPSVEGPAEPDAPFGAEPKRALLCALQIAEALGLQAANCENRMGYAFLGEDHGQGHLATITHLDVVPAGDGWTADPFTLLPFQTKRKQTRRNRVAVTRGEGIFSFTDAFLPSSFLLSSYTHQSPPFLFHFSLSHTQHTTHTHACTTTEHNVRFRGPAVN